MRQTPIVALVLAVMVPTSGFAADRFDLLCHVNELISDDNGLRSTIDDKFYRIDLKSRQWCADRCLDGPRTIAQITPTMLTLTQFSYGQGTMGVTIDRIAGRYRAYMTWMGANWYTDLMAGTCEVGKFTGIPVLSPKF